MRSKNGNKFINIFNNIKNVISKTYLIIILDLILLCIHLHSSLKWHKFFKLQWNLLYGVYNFSEVICFLIIRQNLFLIKCQYRLNAKKINKKNIEHLICVYDKCFLLLYILTEISQWYFEVKKSTLTLLYGQQKRVWTIADTLGRNT